MLLLYEGETAARDTLRFAEEKAGFGLWQIQFSTGQLKFSPNSYRLLGLPVDTKPDASTPFSFTTLEAAAHPDDWGLLAEIKHVMAQGLPFDRDFRVIHSDRRLRTLAIHGEVLFDAKGHRDRVIGVLVDITNQVEHSRSNELNSERMHILMNSIGGTLWTARPDGFCTGFLLKDSGKTRQVLDFLGTNWHNMVHPDDLDKTLRVWAKASNDKKPFTADQRVRESDGSYQWRRNYFAPILDETGETYEWMGLSHYLSRQHVTVNAETQITGAQIRAGRGILNWSVRNLADRTGLSPGVVRRIEEHNGVSRNNDAALLLIKDALSAAGVSFFTMPDGEAGVYPAKPENRIQIVSKNTYLKKNSA